MIASSAARWSVSDSSRRVSSNSRAFSRRHAQAGRDRAQQPDVGFGKRILAIEVLEGDDPLGLVADDERRPEGGPGRLTGQRSRFSECRELGQGVQEQRLARLQDAQADRDRRRAGPRPSVLEGDRLIGEADSALDRVRELHQVGLPVVDPDIDDLGVEDLADLVADQVIHRLHVELGREALLDARDDRQLGRSLVGLGQEPPRLVEQARVLERNAHARREGRQQALVGLGVRLRRLGGYGDDPEHPARRPRSARRGTIPCRARPRRRRARRLPRRARAEAAGPSR